MFCLIKLVLLSKEKNCFCIFYEGPDGNAAAAASHLNGPTEEDDCSPAAAHAADLTASAAYRWVQGFSQLSTT